MRAEKNIAVMPSRRWLIGAATCVAFGGGLFAAKWFNVFANTSAEGALSVEEADRLASRGEIYIIDIRRPDEWERTGVASTAIPIDMRRADFVDVLQSLFETSGRRPTALICARGVRSNYLRKKLEKEGIADIIDVPEGMLGSGAGAGWVSKGLPTRTPTDAELSGLLTV